MLNVLILLSFLTYSRQSTLSLKKASVLRKWLIDGNAYIHPLVEVDIIPGLGYGLITSGSIPPSTKLCVIPEEFCFHATGSNSLEKMTTQLAIEKKKGKESFYYPFIDTLPEDVSFVPALWGDEKIQDMGMKGTQIEKDSKSMYLRWHDQASHWIDANTPEDGISVSDWLWARATLQCRAFSFNKGIQDENKEKLITGEIVAFIPFLQIANHDDNYEKSCVTSFSSDIKVSDDIPAPNLSFSLRTSSNIKHEKSQQIYNHYGELSFQQKILSFGWVDRGPGYCITAISIPSKGISDTAEIETKSDIFLASVISNEMNKNENEKEINLKDITMKKVMMRFEIRNLISQFKLLGGYEDDNTDSKNHIFDLENILLMKKQCLEEGMCNINNKGNNNDMNNEILNENFKENFPDINNNVLIDKQINKKDKKEKNVKKINTKKVKSSSVVKERVESDGEYIRRIELEAVTMLLILLPSCV
mmetsp:Transcript_234/g.289  ORF Transcript_234/g.289 Transcript_234/m.289 type:complete len:475 (+) Transcript_234:398-1822(+)